MTERSETSAGGVVFRNAEAGAEIAVGEQIDRLTGARTVRLPKGRPDPGEDLETTALREVREETGLDARIVSPLGSVAYAYREGQQRVAKEVHFFLMRLGAGEPGPGDGELERILWLPLADAEVAMSFETEREVVRRAETALAKVAS